MTTVVVGLILFGVGFWAGRKHARSPAYFSERFAALVARIKK
jgi:uncharacterized membrane protein YiaA